MEQYLKPKFISAAIIVAAFITWFGVVLGANNRVRDGWLTPVNFGLYALIGSLFIVGGLPLKFSTRSYYILLAINTSLIFATFWYDPYINDGVVTLFFVLSAYATIVLPLKPAYIWIASFYIGCILSVALAFDTRAVVNVLSAGGGFFFFGLFGTILRQTNAATVRARELSDELQATNEQLVSSQQQAEQAAVFEERNRLAREMHDSLGHRLTVAVVQLEGAQRLIPKDPERAADMIGDMRGQLKEGLAELRQTLTSLRSESDDKGRDSADPSGSPLRQPAPFPNNIHTLVNTFSKATNLPVHINIADTLPVLTSLQQHAIYRAAQEGLTNIERHANATEAWLELSGSAETITLTVADNGRGLPEQQPEARFGLLGLSERAEQLGGTSTITPRQPKGSVLTFKIPYEA